MPRLSNHRFEAFAQYYAATLNGAEAARLAGYSAATARQKACNLNARPEIAERVRELRAEHAEKAEVTADYVRTILKREAEGVHPSGTTASARVSAAKALGADLGMFDRTDPDHGTDGDQDFPAHVTIRRTVVTRRTLPDEPHDDGE